MRLAWYTEVNGIVILIMLLLAYRVFAGIDRQIKQILFIRMLFATITLAVLDIAWIFVDSDVIHASKDINFWINAAYYVAAGFCGYCWFVYSETIIGSDFMKKKRRRAVFLIPLFVMIIMTVISYWNGMFFYIDDHNSYQRGPLYVVHLILTYAYVAVAVVHALVKSYSSTTYERIREYKQLANFAVFPFIAGVMQILFVGTPFVTVGLSLSLLSIFLDFQDQKISIDPLTKLNNRNQLIPFLENKVRMNDASEKLVFFMLDVDGFKNINDGYGHVEGDDALVVIANSLKEFCRDLDCFIARYAGDEFCIVYETLDPMEPEIMTNKLIDLVEENGRKARKPYVLRLSVGYARYMDSYGGAKNFIDAADRELYKMKEQRRNESTRSD